MRLPKIPAFAAALFCAAASLVYATQVTVIDGEAQKINETMTGKGFICRDKVAGGNGEKFEIKMAMDKDVLYYLAVITGRGETVIHPKSVTLLNQNKKVITLDWQNTPFGSEVVLHPLTNGNKEIRVVLKQKTDYSVSICTHTASLFHTEQKNSPLDDHGHF